MTEQEFAMAIKADPTAMSRSMAIRASEIAGQAFGRRLQDAICDERGHESGEDDPLICKHCLRFVLGVAPETPQEAAAQRELVTGRKA